MYRAEIVADSIGPNGRRPTTILIEHPMMIEQELLRHRSFSFSYGSTRAIPIQKQIQKVVNDPFIPISWGRAGKGMQATEELTEKERLVAEKIWLCARDNALYMAGKLTGACFVDEDGFKCPDAQPELGTQLKVHKQIAGRLLQPFSWRIGLITATDWKQFFHLRCHPDAQPEIQKLAWIMFDAYMGSTPVEKEVGEWHLPFVTDEDVLEATQREDGSVRLFAEYLCKLSTARCARVSYLTHDGKRDPQADVELHDRLLGSGHWSPMEHQAKAMPELARYRSYGNLHGWFQYRKQFDDENVEDIDELFLESIAQRERLF